MVRLLIVIFYLLFFSSIFALPVNENIQKLQMLYSNMNDFQKAEFFNLILAKVNQFSPEEQAMELNERAESDQLGIYVNQQVKLINYNKTDKSIKEWIRFGKMILTYNSLESNEEAPYNIKFYAILMGNYNGESLTTLKNTLQRKSNAVINSKEKIKQILNKEPITHGNNFDYFSTTYTSKTISELESLNSEIKILNNSFYGEKINYVVNILLNLPDDQQIYKLNRTLNSLILSLSKQQQFIKNSFQSLSNMELVNNALEKVIFIPISNSKNSKTIQYDI